MAVTLLEARHCARVQATLGEGPIWVERDRALWFVDIKAPCVYRLDPPSGRLDRWASPAQVGWLLPGAHDAFLAGLQTGLHRFDPASGAFALVSAVEPRHPGNRLNDAVADPAGVVWFGSMDDGESEPTGRYYRYDRGIVSEVGLAPVAITNGPAVSPDGRTLYVVDTLGLALDAYTIAADGQVGSGRRFATIDAAEGYPDGVTCDADGGVWLGLWNGWEARRYAANGTVTHRVRFPVANVTKVALGGPDGRTAYATTALKGLSPTALAAQPLAGDIFMFAIDVGGVKAGEAAIPREG